MKRIKTQQGVLGVVLDDLAPDVLELAKADPRARVLTVAAIIELPYTSQIVTYLSGMDSTTLQQWDRLLQTLNEATPELVYSRVFAAQVVAGDGGKH